MDLAGINFNDLGMAIARLLFCSTTLYRVPTQSNMERVSKGCDGKYYYEIVRSI